MDDNMNSIPASRTDMILGPFVTFTVPFAATSSAMAYIDYAFDNAGALLFVAYVGYGWAIGWLYKTHSVHQ